MEYFIQGYFVELCLNEFNSEIISLLLSSNVCQNEMFKLFIDDEF